MAQAFAQALENPVAATGHAFHVVSERALTLRGYAEAVAAWFGQPARLSFLPWERWSAAQEPTTPRPPGTTSPTARSMSIAKAEGALGYRPRYTSLGAVFEALAWLVEHGQVGTAGHPLGAGPSPSGDTYQA